MGRQLVFGGSKNSFFAGKYASLLNISRKALQTLKYSLLEVALTLQLHFAGLTHRSLLCILCHLSGSGFCFATSSSHSAGIRSYLECRNSELFLSFFLRKHEIIIAGPRLYQLKLNRSRRPY